MELEGAQNLTGESIAVVCAADSSIVTLMLFVTSNIWRRIHSYCASPRLRV